MFSAQLHIYPEANSHSPRPRALPLPKTSAFPVSPNNARTSSSTSWFSGRRGRNLSLVTRCSFLPLHLQLLSIFTLLSLFPSPLSRSRRLPRAVDSTAFFSPTSNAGPRRSTLWREQRRLAWMEHKQTLAGGRMFLRIEGYFCMSLTCFEKPPKKPSYTYGDVFICCSGKGCECWCVSICVKRKKKGTVVDLTCICLTHNTLSLFSFEQLFPG